MRGVTHLADNIPRDIVVRSVQDLALQEQGSEFNKS